MIPVPTVIVWMEEEKLYFNLSVPEFSPGLFASFISFPEDGAMAHILERKYKMDETTRKQMELNKRAREIESAQTPRIKNIVRPVAVTGILSAAAFALQYLELAVPIMPGFIKFDFSDLPALLGSFALGPLSGIIIEFIKNLLHASVSQSFGVGEISNFILGAVFAGVAGLIYKRKKTKKRAVIGSALGALLMALISYPANLFLVYPFYYNFMPEKTVLHMYQLIMPSVSSMTQALLVFNVPFTFVKGMISVIITLLIYKPLSPVLHGRNE